MRERVRVAGAVLIVLLAGIGGVRLDLKGFAVNLLAGVVLLGVTLLGVDQYLKRLTRERWARTQALTARAIAVHLGEITGNIFRFYHIPFGLAQPFVGVHSSRPLDPAILTAFGPMLDALRHEPRANEADESPSDAAVRYYDDVNGDLAEISTVLTPRLLESPARQAMIDRLVEFDGARRELQHAIIAHQQAVTQSVFPKLIGLVESAQRLYAELLLPS